MRERLPPLSSLRAFEAVARLGSVSRAAEELGRTHGAVSKQIRALQEDAGTILFDKAGTGLRPNAAGRALAQTVGAALDSLAEGYARTVRAAPDLNVACSASFAMGWLAPRLPDFSARYPKARIRLTMTSAREMRLERDADLVILWDCPPAERSRAIPLAPAAFAPVAAPGYPAAVADGRLTAPRRILHEHTARAWDQWSALSGAALEPGDTLSYPHTHLCLAAAAAGMGAAIAERRMAAPEIAAGRLTALSPFVDFPDGFVAIPHRTRALSPEAAAFAAWLSEALQAGPPSPTIAP